MINDLIPNGTRAVAPSTGVANCYVFKSRLQEYAQKATLPTPEYQTIKEGPSHEPVFKSTVIVNNVRYDSLPGFYNRKAAEQSAAEIALKEIHKSGQMTESCIRPVQEYAPGVCTENELCNPILHMHQTSLGPTLFTCTVEIGGIQYIGAAAKTKKEAEIKAARTALLAIQSQSSKGVNGASQYTVLPGKKKGKEPEIKAEAPPKQLKPKKSNFKKKWKKRRFPRNNVKTEKDEPGTGKMEDSAAEVPPPNVPVLQSEGQNHQCAVETVPGTNGFFHEAESVGSNFNYIRQDNNGVDCSIRVDDLRMESQ
uniref:DRBM domain-containing protein n=1 Tax=Ananas comosus var. bracteatus TaxID=296719 RepID=A0A6V7NKF8_ANACO|nr:unnamed protein product [Ananas comosus var. bracteatus]